jgi:hypothetical protein
MSHLDGLLLAASEPTLPVIGGSLGLLLALAGYLLRELNRSSGGAWRVVRERNREIHRLRWSEAHWQHVAGVGEDPGPYVPPTEQELKTW